MCKEQEIVNIICKYFRTGKEINSAQKAAKELKALIEQENAGMREALQEAQMQLQYCDERFPLGTTVTVIAKIDAVLEGK